jgi:molybdopterin adenylyltransferase
MSTIIAVCISDVRGVQKTPVAEIELLADHGVKGDAHAGEWHRQVSLLADESAQVMRAKGVTVGAGAFGENILTRGIDVKALPIGAQLRIGAREPGAGPAAAADPTAAGDPAAPSGPAAEGILLEVTQIGKVCHNPCAIYALAGECIMPTDGIFCRVLRGGLVRPGDAIEVVGPARSDPRSSAQRAHHAHPHPPADHGARPSARRFRVALVVLSDSRSTGAREDLVVPTTTDVLASTAFDLIDTRIIPDDEPGIVAALRELVARDDIHLILTSGGTGLAPRDHAPEATRAVIEREAPGLPELLRMKGLAHTPRAMLTRGVAGTAGRTLIVNLPGSPKAVREGLDTLLPILPHALETLLGQSRECARE